MANITETEMVNLLALHGLRAEVSNTGALKWFIYKGDDFLVTWRFTEPLEYYVEALNDVGGVL